jgi:hypothetical protein
MQPKPVAPGFVAAADRGRGRQAEVRFRACDFYVERLERPGRHLASHRWWIHSGGHRQHPLGVAELEREI